MKRFVVLILSRVGCKLHFQSRKLYLLHNNNKSTNKFECLFLVHKFLDCIPKYRRLTILVYPILAFNLKFSLIIYKLILLKDLVCIISCLSQILSVSYLAYCRLNVSPACLLCLSIKIV